MKLKAKLPPMTIIDSFDDSLVQSLALG